MLFFKGKQKDGKPKKRSILGFLFNPEIGMELKPLGESTRMFVRMLALVFAMSGLFPKDHPAMKDETIRLTLREVFETAWNGLRFTREGLPQVLIFFAVVIMLVMSALFIFVFIMALFSGGAHAADPGIFDEPAGRQDWAINWIDYLFHGEKITHHGLSSAASDCALQEALSKALGFFSSAVLIFAGILLLYHLMSMIIKTAQTGKPFEGANQVWAPIRLVFAIALLVPVNASATGGGACNITGYNSGQYLVMRVAKWGSSLGSNGWEFFLDGLNESTSPKCSESSDAPSCPPSQEGVVALVQPLIVYDACAKIGTHYLSDSYLKIAKISIEDISGTGVKAGKKYYFGYQTFGSTAVAGAVAKNVNGILGFFGVKMPYAENICGGYEIPQRPDGDYGVVFDYQILAFKDLKGKIHKFNTDYYMLAIEKENFKGTKEKYNEAILKQKTDYEKLVSDFEILLGKLTAKGVAEGDKAAKESIKGSLKNKEFTTYGWLMAGSWFNTIARLQAEKFQAINNSLPVPLEADTTLFNSAKNVKDKLSGVGKSTKKALLDYQANLDVMNDNIEVNTPLSVIAEAGTDGIQKSVMKKLLRGANPVEATLALADLVGGVIGIWDSKGNFAVKFGLSQNPIAEITAFGQKYITLGTWALTGAGIAAIVGGLEFSAIVATYKIGPIASFVASTLMIVATIFFLIGFTLGFIVPLYPFYRFFFGASVWIMNVFEAVVLVPLFALAHINPGGDGLPGPKAAYGYQVGMQILLRPILMIFGLVAGFLLFKIMVTFLNVAFVVVSHGTGVYLGMNAMIAKVVYSVIYAALVLALANTCFKTIGLFPQVALMWLGYSKPQEERPDTEKLTAVAGVISGTVLQQHLPTIAKGPGEVAKGMKDNRDSDETKATAALHRQEDVAMQQQLLDKLGDQGGGGQGGGQGGGGHGHAPAGGRSFQRGGGQGGQGGGSGGNLGGGGNTGAGGGNIIQPSGGGQGPRSTTKFDKDGNPID